MDGNSKKLSEEGATSDRFRGKRRKLSEEGASSDRFRGKRKKAVGSRSKFGQGQRKKKKSCPKKEQLQTGLQDKAEKLSEEGGASDRGVGKKEKLSKDKIQSLDNGPLKAAEYKKLPRRQLLNFKRILPFHQHSIIHGFFVLKIICYGFDWCPAAAQ